jgi:acyl-CoA reductase-like NAD-dependent aldehyde dehydrogenase
MINNLSMLVGGELQRGSKTMEVLNPATEKVIAVCPRATPQDVENAIAAAKRAWPAWRDTPVAERGQVLLKIADAIDRHSEELERLITLEQGKPRDGAAMETSFSAWVFRYTAALDLAPEVLQDDKNQRAELHRRGLGVVAAIVPWNFPFLMACYKIAPALMAGNSLVLKPSPTTPLATLRLGELLADIVPPGVLSILPDGGDVGPILSAHPDIAKISFTGSAVTGRSVMKSASDTLKRLTLELGGNDAAIVLDDVDVKAVACKIFNLAFMNSGQLCMSIKRIYVQSSIYEAMCDELGRLAREARVGDGQDASTQFGPVQNKRQYEAIKRVLEDAPKFGRVIAGGNAWGPGYFIAPTIIRDIKEGNWVVDEEIFGPVRAVMKFDTVDEVIERANASPYGIGASVWTSDIEKGAQIASRMESVSSWVNQHFAVAPHIPFGGVKQSGFGIEFGIEGVHAYTSAQSVVVLKNAA